jgi:hypothetical protein
MIMHMFLYNNTNFFAEKMELKQQRDEERLLVHLLMTDLSYNKESSIFVHFDNCFASRLRAKLVVNVPQIPE